MKRPKPKRRAASPKLKREISERQGHACFMWGCVEPIAVFEHWETVALGNDNPPDCGLCKVHAKLKTYGSPGRVGGDIRDIKHIRKLEEKRTQADRRSERGSRMQSRGFDKSKTKRFSGEVVSRDR